jgi:catechol 2,3-dioxygenase-like lactoylglutathione lyase family enzyme
VLTAGTGAGLRDAALLYVFLETRDLDEQRAVLERGLGLPVIEVEPHLPHERHGVVKYDAGGLVLSLNISTPSRFADTGSDALALVFDGPPPDGVPGVTRRDLAEGALLTDRHGHHYLFRSGRPAGVTEVRLAVPDLGAAAAFYGGVLGLASAPRRGGAAFATATCDLVLEETAAAIDGRPPRRHNFLVVFHSAAVEDLKDELEARGVPFKGSRVGYSEIGGTIRFEDPAGHWLCLYQPSEECLRWGSGPKVCELAGIAAPADGFRQEERDAG